MEAYPEARIELDGVVPTADTVTPSFQVPGATGDTSGVLAELEALEERRSVVLVEDPGDEGWFRAEWTSATLGIMNAIEATSR